MADEFDMDVQPGTEEDIEESEDESSSDEGSDAAEAEENAIKGRIKELQEQVTSTTYLYDPHIELIKLLKKEGDLEELRAAREKMSHVFPLTEELWLDWLRDEMKLATSDEESGAMSESDQESVMKLFERAVKDYMPVSIWLEYAQFSIGCYGSKDDWTKVRSVFERAITAAGLHVTKGQVLWEAYREFENAVLSMLQPGDDVEPSEKLQELISQQKDVIATLFRRQLSVPLNDMDKTYDEYCEWVEGKVDRNVNQQYDKACSKLKKLQSYEEALLIADPPRTNEYQAYIDFELKEDDPSRAQCIFERALVENCLLPDIWLKYTKYLETKLKIPTISLPVFERAVRNCPWSVSLWQGYIRAMERYNQPHETVKELVDRALSIGFSQETEFRQLWITYLDYLRRRVDWKGEHKQQVEELRETFLRAHNHLITAYGEEADPLGTVLQYWARIEARYCNNMEKAREIWTEIMAMGTNGTSCQMWIEYLNLERSCGNSAYLRKMYQKAIPAAADWVEALVEMWLNFEREEGTLEQFEAASIKCETRLNILRERAKRAQEYRQGEQWPKEDGRKGKKRKYDLPPPRSKEEPRNSFKKPKTESNEGFKVPSVPSISGKWEKLAPSRGSSHSSQEEKESGSSSSRGMAVEHDSSKDDLTVFLSNLSYTTDEDAIKTIFAPLGEIQEVRLVRDYKGRSKGYCYVLFSSKDAVQEALKKDRQSVEGRPMFVSPCIDKNKPTEAKQKFKYKVGLEKCKLFIKGLPYETTKDDIEEMYKKFGDLKDVRLVTYRNGKSKGLAFVEFIEETAAAMALIKTDQLVMGKSTICVALSNPPERKTPSGESASTTTATPSRVASLGGGPKAQGLRGRGRTQLSLLPRALLRPATVTNGGNNTATTTSTTTLSTQNGNGKEDKKALSNDEFRNLYLKN